MSFAMIPAELRERDQWVVWRRVERDGQPKPTKEPRRALEPDVKADSTRPETWATFEQAVQALDHPDADGIGFVLTRESGLVGIDLDDVLCDAELNGAELAGTPLATWVAALGTYTEISPSGKGLRIIGRAAFPEPAADGRKRGPFEAYCSRRFLTITGDVFKGFLELRDMPQDVLDAFHAAAFPPRSETRPEPGQVSVSVSLDDRELLDRAMRARNGKTSEFSGTASGRAATRRIQRPTWRSARCSRSGQAATRTGSTACSARAGFIGRNGRGTITATAPFRKRSQVASRSTRRGSLLTLRGWLDHEVKPRRIVRPQLARGSSGRRRPTTTPTSASPAASSPQ